MEEPSCVDGARQITGPSGHSYKPEGTAREYRDGALGPTQPAYAGYSDRREQCLNR